MRDQTAHRVHAAGFTLVELMTVLAIITILITILIPVISKIRTRAKIAVVQQQLNEIEGGIMRFYQDQGQYPGPLPNSYLYTAKRGLPAPAIYDATGTTQLTTVTQSENLVLGLLGGLKFQAITNRLCFDPTMVGRGMVNLAGKKFEPYLSLDPNAISTGQYSDSAGAADDSPIPEFLDKFSSPMPILYMRAHVGTSGVVSDDVIAKDGLQRQYVLSDIYPYTHGSSGSIGEGKSIKANEYRAPAAMPSTGVFPHGLQTVDPNQKLDKSSAYPYDLFPYLQSQTVLPTDTSTPAQINATSTARSANTFILISAGPDRVYGTADDICSFGAVAP